MEVVTKRRKKRPRQLYELSSVQVEAVGLVKKSVAPPFFFVKSMDHGGPTWPESDDDLYVDFANLPDKDRRRVAQVLADLGPEAMSEEVFSILNCIAGDVAAEFTEPALGGEQVAKRYSPYDFGMGPGGPTSPYLHQVDELFSEGGGTYAECLDAVAKAEPAALYLHDAWASAWSSGRADPLPAWLQGRFLSSYSEWFHEAEAEDFDDFSLDGCIEQYAQELGESGLDAKDALKEARVAMQELFGSVPAEAQRAERRGRDEQLGILRRMVADILEAELERGETASNPDLPYRLLREAAYQRPDLLSSLGRGAWETAVRGVLAARQ